LVRICIGFKLDPRGAEGRIIGFRRNTGGTVRGDGKLDWVYENHGKNGGTVLANTGESGAKRARTTISLFISGN
jgi:hypothetical protein